MSLRVRLRYTLNLPILPTAPNGSFGIAFVDIAIDEQGKVVQVTRRQGPDALLAAVEEAVSNWQFEPFVGAGNAVQRNANLMFIFSDKGVSSPVLNQ